MTRRAFSVFVLNALALTAFSASPPSPFNEPASNAVDYVNPYAESLLQLLLPFVLTAISASLETVVRPGIQTAMAG